MSESISNERLSKRNLWGYSMGGIGRDMAYQLVNTYLLTFITFTKGLSTTEFAMVGVIMVLCRIFDGCNDPFMGSLIEITRTKIGKFKPWILAGVITNVAVIIALFCVPLRGTQYLIFFAFGYLLWGMTYTMNDISYWGMMPSLSSNPSDRNNLATLANIGAGIGAGLAVISIPSLTQGDLAIASSASKSYAIVSIIVCIFFFACQIMTVFVVKEKPLPKVRVDDGEKRSLKEMFKVIFKNDQLKHVMASMLLYSIGSGITMALASYWIYYRFAYQGLLVTLFTVISGISTLVIVFFPLMCKKHSRRWISKLSMIMIVVGYLLMFVLSLTTGINDKADKVGFKIGEVFIPVTFIFIGLSGAFAFFGQTLFYQVLTISVANTVEYNEYTTGIRDEGVIFACRPFTTKLGSAAVVGITTLIILVLGLNPTNKAISNADYEAGQLATKVEQLVKEERPDFDTLSKEEKAELIKAKKTEIEKNNVSKIEGIIHNGIDHEGKNTKVEKWQYQTLFAFMTLLPLLILLCSFAIYFKRYDISEERYDFLCAEIEKRKLVAEGNAEVVMDGADTEELASDIASSVADTPDEELEKEVAEGDEEVTSEVEE